MISVIDCEDIGNVTHDELEAIEIGGHFSVMEACALANAADAPQQNRQLFRYISEYVEYAEGHDTSNGQLSRKAHATLNHFADEHALV